MIIYAKFKYYWVRDIVSDIIKPFYYNTDYDIQPLVDKLLVLFSDNLLLIDTIDLTDDEHQIIIDGMIVKYNTDIGYYVNDHILTTLPPGG